MVQGGWHTFRHWPNTSQGMAQKDAIAWASIGWCGWCGPHRVMYQSGVMCQRNPPHASLHHPCHCHCGEDCPSPQLKCPPMKDHAHVSCMCALQSGEQSSPQWGSSSTKGHMHEHRACIPPVKDTCIMSCMHSSVREGSHRGES